MQDSRGHKPTHRNLNVNLAARHRARALRAAGLAGVAAGLVVSAPGTARADFSSDALAIVEQLVEDDVVTQVVPNVAASFPPTCDLFPATIYALRAKRYSGLPTIIRQELADNLGLVVLVLAEGKNLRELQPALPPVRPQTIDVLNELVGKGLTAPSNVFGHNLCSFDASVGVKQGSDVITFRTQQTLPKGALITLGDTTQYALATALDRDTKDDLLDPATQQPVNYPGATGTVLANSVPVGEIWAPQSAVATTVMQSCAATQDTATAEIACGLALGTRDLTMGSFSSVQADLRRVLMATATDALEKASAFPRPQPPPQPAPGFPQDLAMLRAQAGAPTVASSGLPPAALAAVQQVLALSSSEVTSIDQFIAAVNTFMQSGVGSQSQDVVKVLATLATLLKGATQVVSDVQVKDYGQAANDAFGALDQVAKQQCPSGSANAWCSHTAGLVREFLRATTVYAVDSAVSGNVDTTVSSGFRSAAVALIEDAGGSGIRVSQWIPASRWYLPEFSLRESLRPGFAGATSLGAQSSAFVTYASVDYPNLRARFTRPGSHVWLGANFSALDAIGPFVELAERNPTLSQTATSSVHTDAFLLGFIVPRLDFELALPDLTKNLVVGLGAAARFYRADQALATGLAPVTATYCVPGNSAFCAGGNTFNGNNFEASVFVKYVP